MPLRILPLILAALLVLAAPASAQPRPSGQADPTAFQDDTPFAAVPAPHGVALPGPTAPSPSPYVARGRVAGRVAMLRSDGTAAIPRGAPRTVQAIIAAANRIIGMPYKWGGGHARIADRGYDCSGAMSFALISAGLLPYPVVSGTFARWGSRGPGRWTAIYANARHAYLEVAGLRLDTSAVGDPSGRSGVQWRGPIGRRPGFHARHVPGL